MKRLFCLLTLALCAGAATAQTLTGAAAPEEPGLKIENPRWADVHLRFTGFGDITPPLVGGPGRRTRVDSPRPGATNAAAYHPPTTLNANRFSGAFRMASVAVTNTGTQTVKSLRLEFVFTDPATGAEVLRVGLRKQRDLRPGATRILDKTLNASARNKRADAAVLGIELTEVVYADGTVWRRP